MLNTKLATPGPTISGAGESPSSAVTSGRSTDSYHGPPFDSLAIQTITRAVVDAKPSQPCSMPRGNRKPLADAAFCASVRTMKPFSRGR
jgi:hypothetical protein